MSKAETQGSMSFLLAFLVIQGMRLDWRGEILELGSQSAN